MGSGTAPGWARLSRFTCSRAWGTGEAKVRIRSRPSALTTGRPKLTPGLGVTVMAKVWPPPVKFTACRPTSGSDRRWGPTRNTAGMAVYSCPCHTEPLLPCCSWGAGPVPSITSSTASGRRRTLSCKDALPASTRWDWGT